LLAIGAPLAGCVPERSLSSYADGTSSASGRAVAAPSNRPGAGVADVPDAGGPSGFEAVPIADAGLPPGALACRDECTCERRGDWDFMFCGTAVTRDEAAERCEGAGGTLASVDDSTLNAWLTERMQALAEDDFWLSGSDAEGEGVWRWQDGRVFFDQTGDAAPAGVYAPWQAMQPNDLNGEDCMRSIAGTWRDLDCGEEIAFVCQG
jgi:hypothetical protein